jgi:hypothetical protein
MISPLVFSDTWHRRPGITQINNLNIQINYDPYAIQNRLLRQSPNDYVTWNNITVNLGQPTVGLWYYTLPSYMRIPETIAYPYAQITNFVYSDGATITPATPKFQLTSASVQLQSIPHLMYVNVRKLSSTLTVNDPDFSIPIIGINLTWTNQSGILSTLTQENLYAICLKNGLKQSWAMFSGKPFKSFGKFLDTNALFEKAFYGPSAALCLEFGSDIQLLDGDYPGKAGVWNLQVQVTCANNRSDNYVAQLELIFVYHGYMYVQVTNVTLNVGFNGSPTGEYAKVTYPTSHGSEGYFQGGKFDLGELLNAVPVVGPMLKTGYNLITSLISDNTGHTTPGTVTTYVPHPEAYRTKAPRGRSSISRQIQYEPDEYE